MNITISNDLNLAVSGVYKITFSNGLFYIGSSRDLRTRVMQHSRYFKSNFTTSSSCKTLEKMSGYDGEIHFSLLEEVQVKDMRYGGRPTEMINKEMGYIKSNKGNNLMLNDIRKCGDSVPMGAYINKSAYDKVKDSAKVRKIGISEMVEMIIEAYYK